MAYIIEPESDPKGKLSSAVTAALATSSTSRIPALGEGVVTMQVDNAIQQAMAYSASTDQADYAFYKLIPLAKKFDAEPSETANAQQEKIVGALLALNSKVGERDEGKAFDHLALVAKYAKPATEPDAALAQQFLRFSQHEGLCAHAKFGMAMEALNDANQGSAYQAAAVALAQKNYPQLSKTNQRIPAKPELGDQPVSDQHAASLAMQGLQAKGKLPADLQPLLADKVMETPAKHTETVRESAPKGNYIAQILGVDPNTLRYR